jgi:hypothetical protein
MSEAPQNNSRDAQLEAEACDGSVPVRVWLGDGSQHHEVESALTQFLNETGLEIVHESPGTER